MRNIRTLIAMGGAMLLGSIALSIGVLLLLAYPFEYLWNYAVVPVFRLATLDYSHALGLLMMVYFLRWAVEGVSVSGKVD